MRRIVPLIRPVLKGLTEAGVRWQRRGRYVILNDGTYRGRYQHPRRSPRQRSSLVIYKMYGARGGRIIRTISTLDEAAAFRNNPQFP